MTMIDRTSPVPIYHQLKTLIQRQIENGVWHPGHRIPTERELCETHGISRSPVRQALSQLAREGLLIRRPGLGTFVSDHGVLATPPPMPVRMMCSDPHWSSVLDHVSTLWNAEHGDRTITFDVDVVPHARFYDLLTAAVGRGTAPDVAMVDSVWVAGLAKAGFLYAFEPIGSPGYLGDSGSRLYAASVAANSLDGHLYGLPVKADASLLWYRSDWFAEEGLAPPGDWDDLLDVSVHFLRPDVKERYGFTHALVFPGGTAGGEATVYSLMPFVWSAGGEIFDSRRERVILNSPATAAALAYLRRLVQEARVSPPDVAHYDSDVSPRLFATSQTAMALGCSYEAETIQSLSSWSDEEFPRRVGVVAPPPPAPGHEPTSTIGGTSYVILRQCEQPQLVTEILRVATDPALISDLYRSRWLNPPSPSVHAGSASESGSLMAQISDMIASARARPSIPEYVKVSRQLQAMFQATISGTEPVDDIAQRTAQFIGIMTELPYQPAQLPAGPWGGTGASRVVTGCRPET